jgi:uracil-DNA glycosylase family 4
VALVNPQMMVLLGATALKYFVKRPSFSMQSEAGKRFRDPAYPGVEMMVLFHPAYLLYDPRKRGLMRDHLAVLKDCLDASGLLRPAPQP